MTYYDSVGSLATEVKYLWCRDEFVSNPGPLFTKKTPFYQNRDSHYKPETGVRPS